MTTTHSLSSSLALGLQFWFNPTLPTVCIHLRHWSRHKPCWLLCLLEDWCEFLKVTRKQPQIWVERDYCWFLRLLLSLPLSTRVSRESSKSQGILQVSCWEGMLGRRPPAPVFLLLNCQNFGVSCSLTIHHCIFYAKNSTWHVFSTWLLYLQTDCQKLTWCFIGYV